MPHATAAPAYLTLPEAFYRPLAPTAFPAPQLFALNRTLAGRFGFEPDWLDAHAATVLSGAQTLYNGPGVAMAYAGHQFGHYAPLLGDGRARLAGEVVDGDGARHEVHLKGAGLTPFARGGDGKATLGAAVREYLISEAMAGLDVPSSRSLAIIMTGERVIRAAALPGAVLARTARSHLRVGTFQYAAANLPEAEVAALARFAIERLAPELMQGDAEALPVAAFLKQVAQTQATLIAQWMSLGFIHGVMNTDNMALSGETIDYGPCAFMDVFHPGKVFSSIDYYGRYAWNKQVEIGLWNLSRLAESLLVLLPGDEDQRVAVAEAALADYPADFRAAWIARMCAKLGIANDTEAEPFINLTLAALMQGKADFTQFFTALTRHAEQADAAAIHRTFADPAIAEAWLSQWTTHTGGAAALSADTKAAMRAANPVRIPRNHQVEAAIKAAESGDRAPFDLMLSALSEPHQEDDRFSAFEAAPAPDEVVQQTFCGT